MARVTVEDCIVQVPNRFELVLLAAQRAADIAAADRATLAGGTGGQRQCQGNRQPPARGGDR